MIRQLTYALLLLAPAVALAAGPRTFTDQEGDTLKAEFTGVKDGEVMLKEKGTRRAYSLSDFSLDDRDFIIDNLKDRKQDKAIKELVDQAIRETNQKSRRKRRFDSGENRSTGTGTAGRTSGGNSTTRRPDGGRPTVLGEPAILGGPPQPRTGSDSGTEVTGLEPDKPFYGIYAPTDELLETPDEHRWTDLLDRSQSGKFEQVVEPGVLVLRNVRTDRVQRIPLVILSRADVEYIQELLNADKEREVFPAGEFRTPTTEQLSAGNRVWTDRKGEKLTAKFVRLDGKSVVLTVGDEERPFPLLGFSRQDKAWIAQYGSRAATASNTTILGGPMPTVPIPATPPKSVPTGGSPSGVPSNTTAADSPPSQAPANTSSTSGDTNGPAAVVTSAETDWQKYIGYGMIGLLALVIFKKMFG